MRVLLQFFPIFLKSPLRDKKGQTLVEYALILAVMSVIAVGVFGLLSSRIELIFSAITRILDTAQSSH